MRWKCDIDGKGTNNIGKDFLKRAANGEPSQTAIGYEATNGSRAILKFMRRTQNDRTVWVVHCSVAAKSDDAPKTVIVHPLLTSEGLTSVVEAISSSRDVKEMCRPGSDIFLNLLYMHGTVITAT